MRLRSVEGHHILDPATAKGWRNGQSPRASNLLGSAGGSNMRRLTFLILCEPATEPPAEHQLVIALARPHRVDGLTNVVLNRFLQKHPPIQLLLKVLGELAPVTAHRLQALEDELRTVATLDQARVSFFAALL